MISPRAGPRPVAITLARMRRAIVKANLQRPRSTSVSTINHGFCYPPAAPLFALDRVAIVRSYLPCQPNPHSRVRGTSSHHNPRVRSLAAFGRRTLHTRLRRSWPASETLHNFGSAAFPIVCFAPAVLATSWMRLAPLGSAGRTCLRLENLLLHSRCRGIVDRTKAQNGT